MFTGHLRCAATVVLGFLTGWVAPSTCTAGLIIEALNVTTSPGQTGSFDVVIINTDSTNSYDIASDVVQIDLVGLTHVKFTDATINTALPHIYVYQSSGTLVPPPTPLWTTLTDTSVTISDSEFAYPPGYRVVAPGASFGLAHVTFSVDSSAPFQVGTISINKANTSLADGSFPSPVLYPFSTQDGTFTIAAASVVPEPSSMVSLLSAGTCLLFGAALRKRGI